MPRRKYTSGTDGPPAEGMSNGPKASKGQSLGSGRTTARNSLMYDKVPFSIGNAGGGSWSAGPPIVLTKTYTGVDVPNLGWFDGALTKRAAAYWFEWPTFDINCTSGAIGTNIEGQIANFIDTMFLEMMQKLSQAGRFINQVAIVAAGQMRTILNAYAMAFLELRGLQGIMAISGFNRPCSQIAGVIFQNRPRLEADLARLEQITMPTAFTEMLDRLCGAFVLSDTAPAILSCAKAGAANPVDDISSGVTVGLILTDAEAQLTTLFNLAVSQPILNVFANLFGPAKTLGPKPVDTDPAHYWQFLSMASQFRQTTTPVTVFAPNVVTVTTPIILVPKGCKDPLYMSLIRPTVYGITDNVATPVSAGALQFPTNVGTFFGVYAMDNTFNAVAASAAAFNPSSFGITWVNNPVWMSQVWYGPWATNNTQFPDFHEFDLFYVTRDLLTRETMAWLADTFLSNFSGRNMTTKGYEAKRG